MITREQVADLNPGDEVELSWPSWNSSDVTITARGVLRPGTFNPQALFLGDYCIRTTSGGTVYPDTRSLTVIRKAPKPFYVNHPREKPAAGDVVAVDGVSVMDNWRPTWAWSERDGWISTSNGRQIVGGMVAHPLLLIDGETGQVVP